MIDYESADLTPLAARFPKESVKAGVDGLGIHALLEGADEGDFIPTPLGRM